MDKRIYDTSTTWGTYTQVSTNTVGFYKLRRENRNATLPRKDYLFFRIDGESPKSSTYNGLKSERDARGYYRWYDAVQNGYLSNGTKKSYCSTIQEVRNVVNSRLMKKIRNQDVDLGVALGEYRETAAFFKQSCVKVSKSAMLLKRGRVSEALSVLTGRKNDRWRDIPGATSNAWLAYSYGLRPLISDVYGAVEALENRLSNPSTIRKTTGHFVRTNAEVNQLPGPGYGFAYSNTVYGYLQGHGVIEVEVDNPLLYTLDNLGVLNPLSVAWELVPYSFVVDWFVPVGAFLQNIRPPQGVAFKRGWTTVKGRGLSSSSTVANRQTALENPPGWNTRANAREFFKDRKILSTFPSFNLVVPDLSLSIAQVGSGLALLYQSLERGGGVHRRSNLRI